MSHSFEEFMNNPLGKHEIEEDRPRYFVSRHWYERRKDLNQKDYLEDFQDGFDSFEDAMEDLRGPLEDPRIAVELNPLNGRPFDWREE